MFIFDRENKTMNHESVEAFLVFPTNEWNCSTVDLLGTISVYSMRQVCDTPTI